MLMKTPPACERTNTVFLGIRCRCNRTGVIDALLEYDQTGVHFSSWCCSAEQVAIVTIFWAGPEKQRNCSLALAPNCIHSERRRHSAAVNSYQVGEVAPRRRCFAQWDRIARSRRENGGRLVIVTDVATNKRRTMGMASECVHGRGRAGPYQGSHRTLYIK